MIRQTLAALGAASLAVGAVAAIAAMQSGSGSSSAAPVRGKSDSAALRAAIAASTRTPANVARDRYRHPLETLTFFGVEPDDTVVEIWPGGGWYTEILAPYVLPGGGTYYAAAMGEGGHDGMRRLMTANPALYGGVRLAAFPAFAAAETRVPDGSADVVLTFRNVHNWQMGYQREQRAL